MSSNTFLVTGAAGWLGRGLLNAITTGIPGAVIPGLDPGQHGIRALVLPGDENSATQLQAPQVSVMAGDVRDAEAIRRFCESSAGAVLIHTAGIIHPSKVKDFYSINVDGTANVLTAAARAGVRRAVIVSSNSPCGCNPHRDHVFDEDSPYHAYMNYGRSKMLMEQAVRKISADTGIETVIIRAPWFYGPFQPPRQNEFFRMIRDGKGPIVGDGYNRRSMAYIDNLAQGILLACHVPQAAGRVYWIADERPYTMREIIDTIERLLETEFGQTCKHRRLKLPGLVAEIAEAVDWGLQKAGLYHQKIHVLSEMDKTIACSIERAQYELGYRPTCELEEGMRRSLRWVFEQTKEL